MPWPALAESLRIREREHLYRRRQVLLQSSSARCKDHDRAYKVFCSNDYLGLAHHPQLVEAAKRGLNEWGVGSTASHLVNGHCWEHEALEKEIAEFLGRERALVFSSGYAANIAVLDSLPEKHDAIFQDRLNHASLLDGGRISAADSKRFLHNDAASLESKLAKSKANRKFVVMDGVFSMDGDLARLPDLLPAIKKHSAVLMLDDAHGFGVLGEHGRGTTEHFQLDGADVPILVGTLGKALGVSGAFVAGDAVLIESLIQQARSYIYSTAQPPALAAALRCGLKLLSTEAWRREKLRTNIDNWRAMCEQHGLPLSASNTAIQPLVIGSSKAALDAECALKEKGLLVKAIRPPTVPRETARLRICLSAAHEQDDLEQLLAALLGLRAKGELG